MGHHERVSSNAPPHTEAWFCFELGLEYEGLIHRTGACHKQDSNLDSNDYEPSALPLYPLAVPLLH